MEHTIETKVHPPHFWKEPVTDAYKLLAEFFDYVSLHQHQYHTEKFIRAAYSESYAVEGSAGHLVEYYEKTQVLIYAAKQIHEAHDGQDTDIGVDVSAWKWRQQPHHLDDYEVKDPYITIEEVFEHLSYEQWLLELHTWFSAAMHEFSVLAEVSETDVTAKLLYKLPDAMWMLWLKHKQDKNQKGAGQPPAPADDEDNPATAQDALQQLKTITANFFTSQSAAQAKAELWATTKMALTNSEEEPDARQRSNILFLYEQLSEIIDCLNQFNTS